MPTKLSREEVLTFLSTTVHTGHLATVREDGRPHVATIWFIVDGEDLVFTTWHTSVKGKNLTRTGYAALSVTDDTPDYTHVTAEGECTVDESPEAAQHWAGVLGGKYMGADRAKEFGERNGIPGEMVWRMKIAKTSGMRDVTG